MSDARLDVGFVPVESPGKTGTGAIHTSTLLIEHLSRHHDLTVYVSSQRPADPATLPARERVEYVLHDDLPMLPHPIPEKHAALESELDQLEQHDLIHSYSSAFIPVLAALEVPTLVTLNSYLAICPKADFRYHGETHCTGPGPLKCSGCLPKTAITRRDGVIQEAKAAYLAAGQYPLVRSSIECRHDISQYQALSPHLRADYIGVGFDPERISVIPHFYDDRFLAHTEQETTRSEGTARLLYVGALQDIKGVDVLIEALPHLEERGVDFELHIAGKGPQESRLRELATTLGVSDRIVWRGHVDYHELPSIYQDADVFVYPGLIDEPFGRVMLEALAAHTPIVSSDIGSMNAIVGPCGRLFEAGDSAGLARAVETLLEDHDRYQRSIEDHLVQFSPDVVIDQFDALYEKTARGGRRS